MASREYGFDMDQFATNKLGNSLGDLSDLYGAMDGYYEDAERGDPADLYVEQTPRAMFEHLSEAEREQLIRQYQYYQQAASDEYGYYDEDDYGYYEDEPGYYDEYPDEYPPEYYEDYNEYSRISVSELCERCVLPTLGQAVHTLYPLLGLCLLTRLTGYVTSELLGGARVSGSGGVRYRWVQHAVCAGAGLLALYWLFEETLTYLVMLALLAYVLLYLTTLKCRRWSGTAVVVVTVVYLITCELFVVHEVDWHRIRGAQMVLAMKVISLAFDLDARVMHSLPSPLEYTAYVFQVGTVIFGPWISFSEYLNSLQYRERKMTFYWAARCVWSGMCALICVLVSTCVLHWLLLDQQAVIWVLAYRDAQSFRFSHYFISYTSQLSATLSGLGATPVSPASQRNGSDVRWDLTVSKPYHIELPRSLVEVVSNWNLPMHFWLKNCIAVIGKFGMLSPAHLEKLAEDVFKTAKPLGNFAAIILTYAASALLHGLNFQLAAVLLSLGFYSYVEFVLRRWLSRVYDACISAKACKDNCDHSHTRREPYVVLLNVGLGCLAAFHLAYLGLMFDNSPDEEQGYTMSHTLAKWGFLGYASHWVMLATYIFYLLI